MAHIFDVTYLIQIAGLFGIFAVIFAESGVFFGFFLPGDSLLFTAGFLASQGLLSFPKLWIGTVLAAVLAGYFGYWFGRTVGHKLFEKADSFFFRRKHLDDTKRFFEKYGTKTIVLSRFVPIVRTFAPIFAGIGEMNFKKFSVWNIFGGVIWPSIFVPLGFYLGRLIPNIERYFIWVVVWLIIISSIPIAIEWWRNRKKSI